MIGPAMAAASSARTRRRTGGDAQTRTGGEAFAEPCLTAWLRRRSGTGPMERVAGIEPAGQPWEGRRPPLHHTRAPDRSRRFRRPGRPSFAAFVDLKERFFASGRRDPAARRPVAHLVFISGL